MNEIEAELIGLHIGDGSLYKTNTGIVWELRGGLDEKEFYDGYVLKLVNIISSRIISAKKRSGGKNGCYGIQTTDKQLIDFFIKYFSPGKKSKHVQIPKEILSISNKDILAACLRGLFATDGTAYVACINKNKVPTYPMIEYCSISKKLRDQIVELLELFDLEARIWTYYGKDQPAYYLRLAGVRKANAFAEKIGLSNPKHRARLDSIKQ